MADRRGLAVLVRVSARRARPDRLRGENIGKKRAARGCKRPKSREETPKEGGGNATTIAIPRCNNMPPRRTKGKSRFGLLSIAHAVYGLGSPRVVRFSV